MGNPLCENSSDLLVLNTRYVADKTRKAYWSSEANKWSIKEEQYSPLHNNPTQSKIHITAAGFVLKKWLFPFL